jgi:hypothetical protein
MRRSYEWLLPFRSSDQNFVSISHISHECYMINSHHPPGLGHTNNIWWTYKLWSSSLCSFLQCPITSSSLCLNISSSSVFSNENDDDGDDDGSYEYISQLWVTMLLCTFLFLLSAIHFFPHSHTGLIHLFPSSSIKYAYVKNKFNPLITLF